MAFTTAFLKRLKSEEFPLVERLKFAEYMFNHVDNIPIISKEDLILVWLCEICKTNREHSWETWVTLNLCLRSPLTIIRPNIRQHLIDTLAHALDNYNDYKHEDAYVLRCCSLVLGNKSMQQYFSNTPEHLGNLIKASLNIYNVEKSDHCNIIQEEQNQLPVPCKLSPEENAIIIDIVESIMEIYRRSLTSRGELRTIFMRDILYPMCNIIDHRSTDSTNRLGVAAYKCIQQLLLGESKYLQHKQVTESNTVFSELFHILSDNTKTSSLGSNLLTYLFILRTAIGTYKLDAVSLDIFYRNLIKASGKYKWEILSISLKLLNDANVTLDFENVVEGVSLSEYFEKLITEILAYDDVRCMHYEILTQLAYVNPVLIERNISNILNKILIEEQTPKYTDLLCAILHASEKLRREPKLISQLLISLKHHIATKELDITDFSTSFLPLKFRDKLKESFENTSHSITNILKTLIYHLNTDCVEMLQSNTSCKNVLMLKATVELLETFFDNIDISKIITRTHVQKFVNNLDEIRNSLSELIKNALCLSYDKNVITILLTAVHSLSEMQDIVEYYVPKTIDMKKLPFPISDDDWQQLIQRINNFGEDNCKYTMNKLILLRITLNVTDESVRSTLIDSIELGYSWSIILRRYTAVISLLRGEEISKVALLLLADMTSSDENFEAWYKILGKECIQENRYFILCLLSHILVQIGQCSLSECTKFITEHINPELLIQEENNKDNKLIEVLQVIKEQISGYQWTQITYEISFKFILYWKTLLQLPTIYLDVNVRTLIFLVAYSVSREYKQNNEVMKLCDKISSDLLETGIDIFQYIEPAMLPLNHLQPNKAFLKAYEVFLRKVTTYDTLKSLIRDSAHCKKAMCTVLECILVIIPKLNANQKVIFRKAERRLANTILNMLPEEISDAFDVKCLVTVLKAKIKTGKISVTLKELAESTFQNVFAINVIWRETPSCLLIEKNAKENSDMLLQESIKLATVILRNRKTFEIQDTTIENLWFVVLKHPCESLLELLLAPMTLKKFNELLKLLYDETLKSIEGKDTQTWNNMLVIWSNIMKTDMHVKRNKMRCVAINNLFLYIHSSAFPDEWWSGVLRLLRDIVNNKHLLIPSITMDLIMMLGLKSLEPMKIESFEILLALCITLVKVRTNLITDRLPSLLQLYRRIINTIVHETKLVDVSENNTFRNFALDIEKFTGLLVKLKKDMIRLSPYVIADLLPLISEGTIPSYMKMALQNSICQLIGICDQHGVAFLSRTLSPPMQEVFKMQLDIFNKFHKYSGKV